MDGASKHLEISGETAPSVRFCHVLNFDYGQDGLSGNVSRQTYLWF
jgi:hypothetical protein